MSLTESVQPQTCSSFPERSRPDPALHVEVRREPGPPVSLGGICAPPIQARHVISQSCKLRAKSIVLNHRCTLESPGGH